MFSSFHWFFNGTTDNYVHSSYGLSIISKVTSLSYLIILWLLVV
uniref:Uncharacterized protein n=1 Tax=Manihot esculenta TaxID=3983 RepID=A0A2C9WFK1_MANES